MRSALMQHHQFVEFVINNGVSTKGNGFVWRPTQLNMEVVFTFVTRHDS